MKHNPIFLAIPLMAGSIVVAQEDADLEVAEPEGDMTSEVVQATSPLNDLEWMVGRWIDQGEETTITTDCAWMHGGKYLSRSFSVVTVGVATLDGTQVIGWDPTTGQIRSWTFDSAGGFGTGRWTRDGNRWLVKTSFVLASGEPASAINVITYVDPNTLSALLLNRYKNKVGRTVPLTFTASETFDVGRDTASPVSDDYYEKAPFAFEETLKRLYFKNLDPEQPQSFT